MAAIKGSSINITAHQLKKTTMKNLNNAGGKKTAKDTNAVIFDVRTDEEAAEGILENATTTFISHKNLWQL
jgi:predicted sulfurtransferase